MTSMQAPPREPGSPPVPGDESVDVYVDEYDDEYDDEYNGVRDGERVVAAGLDSRVVTAHERFLARRAEVDAARRGRRRRLAVLVVCAIVAVALSAVGVVESGYVDVRTIEVRGEHRVDLATVLRVAAVRRGQPMVGLDTGAAARRLEQLPWVRRASVQRRWPNAVRIVVDEYAASAYLRRSPREVVLLGVDGRVLAITPVAPPGLVEVTGVRIVPEVGRPLYPPGVGGVAAALPSSLRARLSALDLGGDAARLVLRDRSVVVLGSLDQVAVKAQAALAVLTLHPGECTVVDVTVPSAPAASSC